jgi:predicted nucleotidyltransferase
MKTASDSAGVARQTDGAQARRDDVLAAIRTAIRKTAADGIFILYGSRARGDAKPDSDWDVLVLLNKETAALHDFETVAFPLYDAGDTLDVRVSVSVYTAREWERRRFTPFFKNVERDGVRL